MKVPIPVDSDIGPVLELPDLGLRDVSGSIRFAPEGLKADLAGQIENQSGDSHITPETKGPALNCALTCAIDAKRIALTKETSSVTCVPEQARRYFRMFSSPTGELDALVRLTRAEPVKGEAAPIVAAGHIDVRHG